MAKLSSIRQHRLTKRQQQVYGFLAKFLEQNGYPPTLEEIAEHFGFTSVNSAREHLRLLANKGWLRRAPGRGRALTLLGPAPAVREDAPPTRTAAPLFPEASGETYRDLPDNIRLTPLLGQVAAGMPIEAPENLEGYVALDTTMFHGQGLFALRVQGESMLNAGIHDGDVVVVRSACEASKGDLVVALIDGEEATVKRFMPDGHGRLILKAENPDFSDIVLQGNDLARTRIAGKVIGVLRYGL